MYPRKDEDTLIAGGIEVLTSGMRDASNFVNLPYYQSTTKYSEFLEYVRGAGIQETNEDLNVVTKTYFTVVTPVTVYLSKKLAVFKSSNIVKTKDILYFTYVDVTDIAENEDYKSYVETLINE